MKLKNKQIDSLLNALYALGNRQPMKKRWEMTKYSKPLIEANETIAIARNYIIDEEGVINEEGVKTIKSDNKSYVELMNLDIDIKAEYLTLEQMEAYNPLMQDLSVLEPIIKVVE